MSSIAAVCGEINPIAFNGPRGSLIKLLFKNLFLTVVTAGIYRFWAKTRIRQYFWRNVNVDGEPLEYRGTGRELFIGFLIAFAILIPLGLVYQGLELLLAGSDMTTVMSVNAAFYVGFLLLAQVALFRARRYRLSRTAWRGIRCGQDGSSMRFALLSGAWTVLSVITLGLAEPMRRMAVNRMLMNETRFGDQKFAFDGRGRDMFRAWLPVAAMNLCVLGVYAWIVVGAVAAIETIGAQQPPPSPEQVMPLMMASISPFAAALIPVLIVASATMFVWYRVQEFRYSAARTTLGRARFSSHLNTGRVFWLFLLYLVFAVVGFGAAMYIFFSAVSMSPGAGAPQAYLAGVGALFLIMLLMSVIKIAWLNFEILKTVCNTLEIENLVALDTVVQTSRKSPKYGEGMADAFDVDVGGL